jgi:hypothetical protein
MAVDVDIDVGLLKSEIKKTYASVSDEPEKDFIVPTVRAWAEDLDYPVARRKAQEFSARGPTSRRCEVTPRLAWSKAVAAAGGGSWS